MAVTVYAIGRLKRGPETDLVARYTKRLKRLKTTVRELPERPSKDQEGDALLASIPASAWDEDAWARAPQPLVTKVVVGRFIPFDGWARMTRDDAATASAVRRAPAPGPLARGAGISRGVVRLVAQTGYVPGPR